MRARAALLLGLIVLAAAVAVPVVAQSSATPQRVSRAAALPAEPSVRPVRAHPSAGAQLAAVRRLARYGLPLFCGGRARRWVALTFDDGPGPYTRLALRRLAAGHARATFFLVGKELRAYPREAPLERRLAAFGDHTLTHPFLPSLPLFQVTTQIAGARALIQRATGRPVLLFRPPYEGLTPAIQRIVTRLGLLDVLWNVDSADSLGAGYRGIERNVIAGLRPGSIILMHENRGQTIRALPAILAALRHWRLRAVSVPEMVFRDPPSLRQLREGERGCPGARTVGGD